MGQLTVRFDTFFNFIQPFIELIERERFLKGLAAESMGKRESFPGPASGDEYHVPNFAILLFLILDKLKARHARHIHIGNNNVGTGLPFAA